MSNNYTSEHEVLLVSMPFGPLHLPSIGASLLKASIPDIQTKICYFGLRYSERVGVSLYDWLSTSQQSRHCLAGEWIFGASLFPSLAVNEQDYLKEIIQNPEISAGVAPDLVEEILAARANANSFLEFCLEEVLRYQPSLIGFTSYFQQHVASLALARKIKQSAPEITIAFGGPNCEGVTGLETLRQFDFVDIVATGEADAIFPQLVERTLSRQTVAGLPGVHGRGPYCTESDVSKPVMVSNLDSLPVPDYTDYFEQLSTLSVREEFEPQLLFESSRGCWWGERHHCTFCGLNGSTMAFRSKSAGRALEELESITNDHPGLKVMVVDNILDMKYFADFLPMLIERESQINLFYEVKSNLKKDQLKLLRQAGIRRIQPGIESLSTPVLKLMRKGVSRLQNIRLLKWCKEIGIGVDWLIIWGFPGEPVDEYEDMADLVPLLTHLQPPLLGQQIHLERYSPHFDRSEDFGFCDIEPWPAYNFIYDLPEDAIRNLAYRFDFDYAEPTDVESYTQSLSRAIEDWNKSHSGSALLFVDSGSELTIWDSRPSAINSIATLSDLERRLYLACDDICGLRKLRAIAEDFTGSHCTVSDVESRLEPLIRDRLMVREGDSVLSLAVCGQ